jgi:hypothetical protein
VHGAFGEAGVLGEGGDGGDGVATLGGGVVESPGDCFEAHR